MEPQPCYRIVAWSDLYGGRWCVVRMPDRCLVKTFDDPFSARRWVAVWGPIEFSKRAQELSWRAVERLG